MSSNKHQPFFCDDKMYSLFGSMVDEYMPSTRLWQRRAATHNCKKKRTIR